MQKKMLLVVVIFIVVCLSGSSTLALTLMGPPMAALEQGQLSAGAEYSYSKMDIVVEGELLEDVETNSYLATIGYGVTDSWEANVRLGAASVDIENVDDIDEFDINGSTEFAYGFGLKKTLTQQDATTWGILYQMIWEKSEDSIAGIVDIEFDFYEIQIAAGPTYEMNGISIYGGPFLYFLEGDIDVGMGGDSETGDIEQESEFGGYVGAQLGIGENGSCNVEFQIMEDSFAIGGGVGWEFGP